MLGHGKQRDSDDASDDDGDYFDMDADELLHEAHTEHELLTAAEPDEEPSIT